jgi:hypothetical protein
MYGRCCGVRLDERWLIQKSEIQGEPQGGGMSTLELEGGCIGRSCINKTARHSRNCVLSLLREVKTSKALASVSTRLSTSASMSMSASKRTSISASDIANTSALPPILQVALWFLANHDFFFGEPKVANAWVDSVKGQKPT